MSSERDRLAHLETILNQNENEIDFLETTLKKIRKEYHDNKQELMKKTKEVEQKDTDLVELRKVSAQKDHELEIVKATTKKLESRVQAIISGESQIMGSTLTRNQELEQENLRLYSVKVGLEEKVREAALQISHYKNLNEAHEKHQTLSKKNIGKLEEQIERLTNELTEHRKKSVVDINAKSEENTALKFKVEEYANNIEVLKQQLEHKQALIKELGNNTVVEDLRKKLRAIEEKEFTQRYQLEEKKNELRTLQELHKSENEKAAENSKEQAQIILELRNKLDQANESLKEAQLQNKKIQFEVEHEKSVRESIENFRVPMLHRDRLNELNNKCLEYEKKYQRIVEENKKLVSEVAKVRSETNSKLVEFAKVQREDNEENFSMMLSKIQQSIDRTKVTADENASLRKSLEFKNTEIHQLNKEIESFSIQNRSLTLENNKLKLELHSYNPSLNLDLVSKKQINETMEREIKETRERLRELRNELEAASKNAVSTQTLKDLKSENHVLKADLEDKNEMIESLVKQMKVLKQVTTVNSMISGNVTATENMIQRQKSLGVSFGLELGEDYQKQIKELVQKKFELEDDKQRLELENEELNKENREYSKKVSELQSKIRALENQAMEYVQKISILDKEKKIKADAIANRERHLSELSAERNRLHEERNNLQIRVNELEQEQEALAEKVRYYEEYTNKMNQINTDIIGDKEAYLNTLLNHKREIALLEKRYQDDIDKVIKEREELRAQLAKVNSERADLVREHHDTQFSSKLRMENQGIIISNYVKKTGHLEKVIAELDAKVNEYLVSSEKDFEKTIPKLSEISNILNRSRLTVEDYKNFEAIKELLAQQRLQYEDSVKFLETTIETLTQKYLALEESYTNDKGQFAEEINKLKRENFEIINKYENKLKEQEEAQERARKLREKLQARKQQQQQQEGAEEGKEMEVEEEAGAEEGEVEGEEAAEEAGVQEEPVDVEALKAELNAEKEARLNLEDELEKEKERTHQNEEEKTRLLRKTIDLENEKVNLSKIFTLREVSWIEQKKNYMKQMEEFRSDEKQRTQRLNDLIDKVENTQGQEGLDENLQALQRDTKVQDLLVQIENLRSDNLILKRSLEEKRREAAFRGLDMSLEGEQGDAEEQKAWKQKYEVLEAEYRNLKQSQSASEENNDRMKDELADLRAKLNMLEGIGSVGARPQGEHVEGMVTESEEAEEIKRLLDTGSLVATLERAQNLLLAVTKKSTT